MRAGAPVNVPADQGLSSLGLLLQLGGSVAAACIALATFISVLAVRSHDERVALVRRQLAPTARAWFRGQEAA